ncbi:hypothetical protein Nepgr_017406 [Nepenthes gracilis]|uniref:Uncharacterized protein n=1 Tax=Nepenthes gracilis TaxID=150966 RepID=A0AAD3SRD5_NEPGR|nr:hypothetical protein Nepgr_017406 [Nepenthes gracilis]
MSTTLADYTSALESWECAGAVNLNLSCGCELELMLLFLNLLVRVANDVGGAVKPFYDAVSALLLRLIHCSGCRWKFIPYAHNALMLI